MITTIPPTQWRVSRDEYSRLGELGFFESKRVQLIEGQVIQMPPMGSPHAGAILRCTGALRRIVGDRFCIRCQLPLVIDESSEPEPDFAVVKETVDDQDYRHPETAELVIEVADSSVKLDREIKSVLYAKAGVTEYWIVDLNRRCVEVFRKPDVSKAEFGEVRTVMEGESLASLLNPAVFVAVADLLPRNR